MLRVSFRCVSLFFHCITICSMLPILSFHILIMWTETETLTKCLPTSTRLWCHSQSHNCKMFTLSTQGLILCFSIGKNLRHNSSICSCNRIVKAQNSILYTAQYLCRLVRFKVFVCLFTHSILFWTIFNYSNCVNGCCWFWCGSTIKTSNVPKMEPKSFLTKPERWSKRTIQYSIRINNSLIQHIAEIVFGKSNVRSYVLFTALVFMKISTSELFGKY